jgi:hypothetical protein
MTVVDAVFEATAGQQSSVGWACIYVHNSNNTTQAQGHPVNFKGPCWLAHRPRLQSLRNNNRRHPVGLLGIPMLLEAVPMVQMVIGMGSLANLSHSTATHKTTRLSYLMASNLDLATLYSTGAPSLATDCSKAEMANSDYSAGSAPKRFQTKACASQDLQSQKPSVKLEDGVGNSACSRTWAT